MKVDNLAQLRIYHFDRFMCFTHEGVCHGQMDGYGNTIYVLPTNATITEPPEEEGQVAVLDQESRQWRLMESHRGETWYNPRGEPVVIERPGNPLDFGFRRDQFWLA